jgi:VanZ family protein
LTPHPRLDDRSSSRGSRWYAVLAALTVAFLAYGSFVPFHFTPRPVEEAWYVFRHAIPVRVSASDLAANLLLMAPFPFFLLGALPSSRAASGRLTPAFYAWALSTSLSAAVEFGQTYFPPRHPSLVDIAAQSAGAACGALAWVAVGPSSVLAWRRWKARYGPVTPAEWILWPYMAVVFLGRVMPLDLTPSPATLRYKWRAGRVILVPFAHAASEPSRLAFEVAAGAIPWVPVAALLVLSRRVSAASAFLLTTGLAAFTEAVRLLVISRVSDTTDLLTAVLGAAAGASAGAAWLSFRGREGAGSSAHGASPRSPALAHPESDLPSKTTSAEKE